MSSDRGPAQRGASVRECRPWPTKLTQFQHNLPEATA